jgi:hypothetical protein
MALIVREHTGCGIREDQPLTCVMPCFESVRIKVSTTYMCALSYCYRAYTKRFISDLVLNGNRELVTLL